MLAPGSDLRHSGPVKQRIDHRLGRAAHRVLAGPLIRRPRTVFLFGTMRSGSTLLTNILACNPGIAGFGETHLTYDRPAERLLDLRYWIFRYSHRYPGPGRRLLDKILHSAYTPDPAALFAACDARAIFLLRDPAATARSIETMIGKLRPENLARTDIWGIVRDRYRDLAALVEEVPAEVPLAALSYERLLEEPDSALAALSAFLDLETPLSRRYTLPRGTGGWGVGDGSAQLHSGEIAPRPRPPRGEAPDDVWAAQDALIAALDGRAAPALF